MNRSLKLMCVISLALAVTANAQPLEQGDIIVAGAAHGSLTIDDNSNATGAVLLRGGYMVTPEIEVGGFLDVQFSSTIWTVAAYAAYNFTQIGPESIVPYAGGFVGYFDYDGNASGFVWGPAVGVKWFPLGADNIFVNAEYQWQNYNPDGGSWSQHEFLIGLGILIP